MKRILKQEYTAEFKEQVVAMVNNARSVPEVAGEQHVARWQVRVMCEAPAASVSGLRAWRGWGRSHKSGYMQGWLSKQTKAT